MRWTACITFSLLCTNNANHFPIVSLFKNILRNKKSFHGSSQRLFIMATEKCVKLSSGHHMPLLGLGMWQTESEDTVRVAVNAAIDAGYRHIDTAFAYKNEAFIGNVLKEAFAKKQITREELFITSKLPMTGLRPHAVEYFFKKSLNALQLDYLDLYLIHAPIASKRTEDDSQIFNIKDGIFQRDESVDLLETWKAMESLVKKGLVKSIGLSNCNSHQVQRIHDAAEIKPANLQVECHAYLPQYELQEFCKKLNVSLTAYAPIGSPGYATYASKLGFKFDQERLLDDENLKPICKKHSKSPAQVLLRYLVQRDIIVIPKSTNPERIKENAQLFDFKLDEEEMSTLKGLGKKNLRFFTFDFAGGLKEHPEYPFHIPF